MKFHLLILTFYTLSLFAAGEPKSKSLCFTAQELAAIGFSSIKELKHYLTYLKYAESQAKIAARESTKPAGQSKTPEYYFGR